MRASPRSWRTTGGVLLLALAFTLVFQLNLLRSAGADWFRDNQTDSVALVLAGMHHARFTGPTVLGLGSYGYGEPGWVERIHEGFEAQDLGSLRYWPYLSQFGLQGHLFSQLYRVLGIPRRAVYEWVNSALNGLLFALWAAWAARVYGRASGGALALGVVLSPWLVVFARNLYWVTWTWFLPMVAAALALRARDGGPRWGRAYAAMGLGVLLKCLCGYEYVSTVILTAMLPLVQACVTSRASLGRTLSRLTLAGLSGCVGFVLALLVHASARAPTLLEGLQGIRWDALRRTAGRADDGSASATVGSILERYLFRWDRPAVSFVEVSFVFVLVLAGCCALRLVLAREDLQDRALGAVLFFSLLAPLSWLVLAKAHSFHHPHINYVLWSVPVLPLAALSIARAFAVSLAGLVKRPASGTPQAGRPPGP